MDAISIALAVTAADAFVLRSQSESEWSRPLELVLPLADPAPWQRCATRLEAALGFLSGDTWRLDFLPGGQPPPTQFEVNTRKRNVDLTKVDEVCLFSGGLDSGAAALLKLRNGERPLLVSHGYTGDAGYQDRVSELLPQPHQRFSLHAYPERSGARDISMRARSFSFLAFGALAADTLSTIRSGKIIDLVVPENGLIALNAPLTPRRMGSLSTRTTHPHYLAEIQAVFQEVGLQVAISNPYELQTKGEMLTAAASVSNDIETFAAKTVSCGKWKRTGVQCGRCVPCLIRRAALYAANIDDLTPYASPDLERVMLSEGERDDVMAMLTALLRRSNRQVRWIAQSGPLPLDTHRRTGLIDVHRRGLQEVGEFLRDSGLPVD